MTFNPFEQKPQKVEKGIKNWKQLYPDAYDKHTVDPYTRTRVILMNGTEFEQTWFLHQFSRHCTNNDLRREIALIRRVEQQQQKAISCLKPLNESILETTIGYEQLAVDLTAGLAIREPNPYVKQALDFALLEDFDHLYRFADLLEMDKGVLAERLVGCYTEIMPGRPTISEHRFPFDDIRRFVDYRTADPFTKLCIGIITAAEQQTMNYYMNVAGFYENDLGRKLFAEIGMIEEQHVTHYGSLMDTKATWLEGWLMHEYTECYLYYSMMLDETDPRIKKLWASYLEDEISHLHKVAELLKKYENKEWQQVIPIGDFPAPLKLQSNKDYVREVLNSVWLTSHLEDYLDVRRLNTDSDFARYQNTVNRPTPTVPNHATINAYLTKYKKDYRYQEEEHPIPELRDRTKDNTTVARI
ncbi:MAG: hypothetical protein WC292_06755 [Clostridia bacterium]